MLQSSDKVVKTLLDARSLLEIVVARDNNRQQQIAAATSGFGPTSAHHSNSGAFGGGGVGEAGNAARASPPLVFHDMNDIVTNRFQTPGSSSDVINSGNLLSERSRRYDVSHVNNQNNATTSRTLNTTTAAFSDVKTDDVMTVWDSEHALVSPRFQQLSEGATFML